MSMPFYPIEQDIDFYFWSKPLTTSILFPSVIFCHLLIIFTNSLDPDQDRQNVGPDLDLTV